MNVFSTVIIIAAAPLRSGYYMKTMNSMPFLRVHVSLLFELWEMKSHSHLIYFLDKIKSLE